jgi:hypothetical protein
MPAGNWFIIWGITLAQIKVAVKKEFDTIDAIIFEAALTVNEIETKYKQKDYIC